MKRLIVATVSLAFGGVGLSMGCDDGADMVVAPPDAGPKSDATVSEGGGGDAAGDGALGDGAVAQGTPPWLLVSVNGQTSSELVVYGLGNRLVAGRLAYPGFIGLTTIDSLGRPFLFQQSIDRVVELDPLEPWKVRASWDVSGNDAVDGGATYADPVALLPITPGKAYVVRFNRNRIVVIDDTVKGDATAPTKTIDLTQFYDALDTDKSVDPIAAAVVGNKVYVLLANLDINNVDPKGFFTICTASKPKIIVIDPASDTLASVFAPSDGGTDGGDAGGDGGPPAVVSLLGYNPTFNGLVYDAPRNRLLAFNGGCNDQLADGGKGALLRRQVDAINLATGAVTKVLDLSAEGYPSAVVPAGGDEILLGLDFNGGKRWNVTSSSLGASLPDGLSALATDKAGKVFGVIDTASLDGGAEKELVEIALDGGAVTPLGPLPDAAGFVGSADYLKGN